MTTDAIIAFGVLFVLGFAVLILTVLLALIIVKGKDYPMKRKRFEAGNPPHGVARTGILFQYYGYLIVFLAFEPIMIILFLLPLQSRNNPIQSFALIMGLLGLMLPPLAYALKISGMIERWR